MGSGKIFKIFSLWLKLKTGAIYPKLSSEMKKLAHLIRKKWIYKGATDFRDTTFFGNIFAKFSAKIARKGGSAFVKVVDLASAHLLAKYDF